MTCVRKQPSTLNTCFRKQPSPLLQEASQACTRASNNSSMPGTRSRPRPLGTQRTCPEGAAERSHAAILARCAVDSSNAANSWRGSSGGGCADPHRPPHCVCADPHRPPHSHPHPQRQRQSTSKTGAVKVHTQQLLTTPNNSQQHPAKRAEVRAERLCCASERLCCASAQGVEDGVLGLRRKTSQALAHGFCLALFPPCLTS
jgi:hypothetical protein